LSILRNVRKQEVVHGKGNSAVQILVRDNKSAMPTFFWLILMIFEINLYKVNIVTLKFTDTNCPIILQLI